MSQHLESKEHVAPLYLRFGIIAGATAWVLWSSVGETDTEVDGLLSVLCLAGIAALCVYDFRSDRRTDWRVTEERLFIGADGENRVSCRLAEIDLIMPPDADSVGVFMLRGLYVLEFKGGDKTALSRFWNEQGRRQPFFGYSFATPRGDPAETLGCRDCLEAFTRARVMRWTTERGGLWDGFRAIHKAQCPSCRGDEVLQATLQSHPISRPGLIAYKTVTGRLRSQ